MKDIKVFKKEGTKEFVSYNLTKKLAEVFNTKKEFRNVDQDNSDLFHKDLPTVKNLISEKIKELEFDIKNTKVGISMLNRHGNKDRFKEERLKKALKNKQSELSYLINWLKNN